jgi:predicted nucleic acid-binding protein
MIVTLDTNVIINACKENSWDHLDVLSSIRTQNHVVALDVEGKILAEYQGNCSRYPLFQKWYQEIWQRVQQVPGRLENRHVRSLSKIGCHESSDHVFVAVAERTGQHRVTFDARLHLPASFPATAVREGRLLHVADRGLHPLKTRPRCESF